MTFKARAHSRVSLSLSHGEQNTFNVLLFVESVKLLYFRHVTDVKFGIDIIFMCFLLH